MKPILDPKRDLVLEMSTLLCKPLTMISKAVTQKGHFDSNSAANDG